MNEVLERPDIDETAVLELLRKLADWLRHEPQSAAFRKALATTQVHKAFAKASELPRPQLKRMGRQL